MSEELQNKIMTQIKTGKVKLRSRYVFLSKKLGLNSVLVLSIIFAILFFNLVLFYARATDNLGYLSFGRYGILAFLESFPYLLVVTFILLLFGAGYLITKTEWSYKKPFKYLAVGLIVIVLLAGTALAFTDVASKIEEQAFQGSGPGAMFRPFLQRGMEMRGRGISGRVSEIGEGYLVIETPYGVERIDLQNLKINAGQEVMSGNFVMAVGERRGDVFWAYKIRVMDNTQMLMIRRGVHRCAERGERGCHSRFGAPKEEVKKCFDNCTRKGDFDNNCLQWCRS